MPRTVSSWEELGARVSAARRARGFTQADIADELGIDRTAVTKIETGRRELDALELAALAGFLGRPVEWFITDPPPTVISRRTDRVQSDMTSVDFLLEDLARDVELLLELGVLRVPDESPQVPSSLESFADAEAAARRTRALLGEEDGPLLDLVEKVERLGLFAFSFDLGVDAIDGAYLALERGGTALVNGSMEPGRRRFTLAHELGHHVFSDEYSTDWLQASAVGREKLINAFAIHLLLPRESIRTLWAEVARDSPRDAALRIAVEFRVSWTAVCQQLKTLELITPEDREVLMLRPPGMGDFIASGLRITEELVPPYMPQSYQTGAIRAYRTHKISAERAVSLLHGTLTLDELPDVHDVPIDSLIDELDPLGE